MFKGAVIQFSPGGDRNGNIRKARKYIEDAASRGAFFAVLPEYFFYRGDLNELPRLAPESGGMVDYFSGIAAENNIGILLGTLPELSRGKIYDTAYFIDNTGLVAAKYRKRNLFSFFGNKGRLIDEGSIFSAGRKNVVFEYCGFKILIAVCFDLRFSEMFLYGRKAGVDICLIPSDFTYITGKAHWEILLRSRAIENQAYVFAANCSGYNRATGVKSYGSSMIIGPWGDVIARVDKEDGVAIADIDSEFLREVRSRIPMRR